MWIYVCIYLYIPSYLRMPVVEILVLNWLNIWVNNIIGHGCSAHWSSLAQALEPLSSPSYHWVGPSPPQNVLVHAKRQIMCDLKSLFPTNNCQFFAIEEIPKYSAHELVKSRQEVLNDSLTTLATLVYKCPTVVCNNREHSIQHNNYLVSINK